MLRAEFRRRLDRCQRAMRISLMSDDLNGDLLPSLWSLLAYMWCKTYKSHKYVSEPDTFDY